MAMKPDIRAFVVALNGTRSPTIDMQGHDALLGIYVPALTSGTLSLEGSFDDVTYVGLKDTSLTALLFSTNTGGFWMDGDYLARWHGVPYLQIVCGAAQGAARTFYVVRGREWI